MTTPESSLEAVGSAGLSRYEYFDSWDPETQKKLIALDFAIRASNGTSWSDMAGVVEAAGKAEAYLFSSGESAKDDQEDESE